MKKLILLTLIPLGLMAQRNDTVLQQVFTNRGVPTISPNLTNIGQSFHTITAVITGPVGCNTDPNIVMHLESSLNGTNWIPMVSILQPAFGNGSPVGKSVVRQTNGAFPYLRVNLVQIGAPCTVSVLYAGSLFGTAKPTFGMFTGFAGALGNGDNTLYSSAALAYPSDLAIYGINAYNTGATNGIVILRCADGTGVLPNPSTFGFTVYSGAEYAFTLGGGLPLFACPIGSFLQANISGATGNTINITTVLRNEPSI